LTTFIEVVLRLEVHAKRHHIDQAGHQVVVEIGHEIQIGRERVLANEPAVLRPGLKPESR
jgi:hypothetical protein